MADKTKIQWTDATWNPVTGCTPISAGCNNCYARRMANRLKGRYGYPGEDPFRVTFHAGRLEQPIKWKRPRRIFVGSMGDLFHDDVKFLWINEVFAITQIATQHQYLFLTKRPGRILEFIDWINDILSDIKPAINYDKFDDNIWLGVTAEDQATADARIPELLTIPAAVRFVSVEPMLEPVSLWDKIIPATVRGVNVDPLDWVICGAETGPGARLFDLSWAINLRDQCAALGVPFFFKSAGKQPIPDGLKVRQFPNGGEKWRK